VYLSFKNPKLQITENLFLENDEAQAQKLNQGRIFKKMAFFIKILTRTEFFSWFCKKSGKI
jgi:hypothetical protein